MHMMEINEYVFANTRPAFEYADEKDSSRWTGTKCRLLGAGCNSARRHSLRNGDALSWQPGCHIHVGRTLRKNYMRSDIYQQDETRYHIETRQRRRCIGDRPPDVHNPYIWNSTILSQHAWRTVS